MFIYLWLRPKNFFDEKVWGRNYEVFVVLRQDFFFIKSQWKTNPMQTFLFSLKESLIHDGFKAFFLLKCKAFGLFF